MPSHSTLPRNHESFNPLSHGSRDTGRAKAKNTRHSVALWRVLNLLFSSRLLRALCDFFLSFSLPRPDAIIRA